VQERVWEAWFFGDLVLLQAKNDNSCPSGDARLIAEKLDTASLPTGRFAPKDCKGVFYALLGQKEYLQQSVATERYNMWVPLLQRVGLLLALHADFYLCSYFLPLDCLHDFMSRPY
jgi:hypothetical protein